MTVTMGCYVILNHMTSPIASALNAGKMNCGNDKKGFIGYISKINIWFIRPDDK
jgi:hypothetical protein